MFIAHTGYLELFDLVVKHILPGMGLFFYFVLHFNCKFARHKIISYTLLLPIVYFVFFDIIK